MADPSLQALLDLSGKVAIVTGAGQGIGAAIATRLAEGGASLVVTDIAAESAKSTAELIVEAGGNATALQADVAKLDDTQLAVDTAVNTYGRVDILVNNAALIGPSPVMEIDEKLWDAVLSINLKGVFFQAQAAARQMIKSGGGKIINIASVDAVIPAGGLAPYDSSKGGVAMLTKSLAKELGRHGITVNAIAPGGVNTPGANDATSVIMKIQGIQADTMENSPIRSTIGRFAEPDDIARVAYFLSTGLSDYMTGAFVTVDGGYTLI